MYRRLLQVRLINFKQVYMILTFAIVKAKALYTYTGANPDELSMAEGEEVTVIDQSEEEWWKAEQGGVVFIVPAGYLEVVEG